MVQREILALLIGLQDEPGMAMLLVGHDLAVLLDAVRGFRRSTPPKVGLAAMAGSPIV